VYENPKNNKQAISKETSNHQTEYRCMACGRLLGRGRIQAGALIVRCGKCRTMVSINVKGATLATL